MVSDHTDAELNERFQAMRREEAAATPAFKLPEVTDSGSAQDESAKGIPRYWPVAAVAAVLLAVLLVPFPNTEEEDPALVYAEILEGQEFVMDSFLADNQMLPADPLMVLDDESGPFYLSSPFMDSPFIDANYTDGNYADDGFWQLDATLTDSNPEPE